MDEGFSRMKEIELGKRICLMASQLGHRLFRSNVGEGWIGKSQVFSKVEKIEVYPGDVIIRKAKRIHFGLCNGQGDYIGWSKTGKFISIEVKTETGIIRPEQIDFSEAVKKSGGISGIVRDEESAFDILS